MPRPMPPTCRQFMHTNARHMLATFCLMKPKLLGGHICVSVYVRKTLSACVCVRVCICVEGVHVEKQFLNECKF